MPVPMEVQLDWLRELGFSDVECFWKYLNLAIFGGAQAPGSEAGANQGSALDTFLRELMCKRRQSHGEDSLGAFLECRSRSP